MSELLTAAAKPVHPADDIEPTPQAEVVLEPASPIAEIEVPPAPTLTGKWIQAPATNELERRAIRGALHSSMVMFSALRLLVQR